MSDAATLAAHGAERPAHADSGATAPVDSGSLQRAGSAGTVQAGDGASPGPEGPIHAYAKLEFPGFSYYIQTLEVTIGRRPAQPPGGEATAQGSSARRPHGEVDVDLGPLKSISRLHARIYYTVQPELYHAPGFAYTPLPSSLPGTSPGGTNERGEGQGRFVLEVLGRNGAFVDDVWVNAHGVVPLGRRTKIQIAERVFYFVLPPPASASEAESEADESAEQTDASSEAAAHDTSSELSDAETHDAARIRDDTASVSPSAHRLVLKPRSKVTGKKREASADVPLAEDAKRRKEEPDAARKGKDKEERAVTPSSLSALAAAATQVGADSPEEKPQLGNVELITQALSSELCRSKGGKLTLQEVYEWLQSTYPWFSRNGRKTGRDWQSSIRHTIGTSRDFTKIPRRPDEHGKGIFYTLSTSELAQAQDAQRQPLPANVPEKSPSPPSAPDTQPTAAASSGDAAKPAAKEAAPAGMPRIPLVVGIPPGAQQHAAEQKAKGAPGSIESLLETPPIAHHQGKLYLSPNVFGHLTSAQLRHMEGLGAQQALQVLQSYLVNHLKERPCRRSPSASATRRRRQTPRRRPLRRRPLRRRPLQRRRPRQRRLPQRRPRQRRRQRRRQVRPIYPRPSRARQVANTRKRTTRSRRCPRLRRTQRRQASFLSSSSSRLARQVARSSSRPASWSCCNSRTGWRLPRRRRRRRQAGLLRTASRHRPRADLHRIKACSSTLSLSSLLI